MARSFTPEQNEVLRLAAHDLVIRFGTQARLAKELNIHQPSLSNFLSGKFGAGHVLARSIARLKGKSVEELLGIEVPAVDYVDRYPNRAMAIQMARRDGYDEGAIETMAQATLQSENDLPVTEWLLAIRDEERRQRRFGAFQIRVFAEPDDERGVMDGEPRS
jgi:hypothetical protein